MNLDNDAALAALNQFVADEKYSEALPILSQIDIAACTDEATARNMIKVAAWTRKMDLLMSVAAQLPAVLKAKLLVVLDLAQAFIKLDDTERGIHYFLTAQEIAPSNYWSYYWYALFRANNGRYAEALEIIATGMGRCRGRVQPTEWENLQREYLRFLCLSRRDDVRYAANLLARKFHVGRPVPNALFVAMVKDEEDIIYDSLSAAYISGFRYFMIANNASSDLTETEIRRFSRVFPEATVVTVWDPIAGYWQDKKMNAFWHFGVEYLKILGVEIEWIFPVDADEAMVQADEKIDLCHVLSAETSASKKLAVGMWCTAAPAELVEERDPSQDLNASIPVVAGYDSAPFTKVAIRVAPGASLGMGNHFAGGCIETPEDVLDINEFGIFMIHQPYRSKKQYRSKITNGMKALAAATTLSANHGGHWRVAYEAYARRGEDYVVETLTEHFASTRRNSARLAQRAKELG